MTIETRLAFPEGGTECPPEENAVASPTATLCNNAATNAGNLACQVNEDKPQLKGLSRKRKKGRKQRRVLETPNLKSIESSKTDKTTDEITTVEGGGSSSTSPRSEKADDLKKSKVKSQNDGSKVDNSSVGASRKSMRLLLRRGRSDNNYSGFLWPKDRPRYVEDLKLPLDFDDEKTKIMFMDSIGLFPRCKNPKIETEALPKDTCSTNLQDDINILNTETLEPNHLEEKNVCSALDEKMEQEPPNDSAVDFLCGHPQTVRDNDKTSDYSIAACPGSLSALLPSSECIDKPLNRDIDEDDDEDGGWEIWVHRIPTNLFYGQSTIQQSPSQKEINDSLKRLTQLGTEVVLVSASGI
ncbi:hypothetical protein Ocin01_11420 [Orchesella cincta]|uniref:Uncharacterized protein n=1 Tax=Orchesella cincta TaxID=48709 RepID=A0A1D2MQ83_ORCCI|nr:hypothetical protein Ocin01_11420 [Orchesella cincta]